MLCAVSVAVISPMIRTTAARPATKTFGARLGYQKENGFPVGSRIALYSVLARAGALGHSGC